MKKWQQTDAIGLRELCPAMQQLTDAGIVSEDIKIIPTPAYRFDKTDQELNYVILYMSDKELL